MFAVPLDLLVAALARAHVRDVIIVQFGMKRPLCSMNFINKGVLTTACNTRWDIGYSVHSHTIPALHSHNATVRVMYIEASNEGGSLEISDSVAGTDVTIKIYPLAMHRSSEHPKAP